MFGKNVTFEDETRDNGAAQDENNPWQKMAEGVLAEQASEAPANNEIFPKHDNGGIVVYGGEDTSNEEEDDEEDYDGWRHRGKERREFKERKITVQEIPLPPEILERYDFLKELPDGVAVMGGVARSIAREVITGEAEPIRDIDLVNIITPDGDSLVNSDMLNALSRKFMPDDYAFGHGIQSTTLKEYFGTRDFTINQSLVMGGKLIVSNFAYNDFQENIIRPTYYEHPYDGDYVRGRLFLKALMMRSILSLTTKSVPLIEDMLQPERMDAFNIALFLNKAMSRGARTARRFAEDLADWGVVSQEFAGRPVALARELLKEVYNFEFRQSTDELFMDIEECDDMGGFFVPSSMLNFHASDPAISGAIDEYENDPEGLIDVGGERYSGHYTQAEFDDINRYAIFDDDDDEDDDSDDWQ